MNTKVWYLPYFEGVYHIQTVETLTNANARMVRTVHTMICIFSGGSPQSNDTSCIL